MSDRKVDVNLTSKSDAELITASKETRAEKKARLITILNRGVVGDRLHVPLPDDKVGEWVPDDKVEIYRMESMGYVIDTEYASKRALHEGTGGRATVADVVFMVTDRETRDVIEEIRREQYEAANSPRGGRQKEERDFANDVAAVGLPSEIKSRVDAATVENIRDALTAKG